MDVTPLKPFRPGSSNRRALLKVSILVEGGMFFVALVLGPVTGVDFWADAQFTITSAIAGALAGLALLAVAATITESSLPFAVQMRRDIDRLVGLFRGATVADFLLISILAGLGEEALFRGFLQTALAGYVDVSIAIILASLAFGLAHYISSAYVVFTAVLGILFGVLYAWSGNIAVPMIAHAAYDFVALCMVYRGWNSATGGMHADG